MKLPVQRSFAISGLLSNPDDLDCRGLLDYEPRKAYLLGEKTVFNNDLYEAKWYVTESPTEDPEPWIHIGPCKKMDAEPEDPCIAPLYSASDPYAQPTLVTWNGAEYRNTWWSLGEIPDLDPTNNWVRIRRCAQSSAPPPTSTAHPTPYPTVTSPTTSTQTTTHTTTGHTTTASTSHATNASSTPATTATTSTSTTTTAHTTTTTHTTATTHTTTTPHATAPAHSSTGAGAIIPGGPTGPNGECVWPAWERQNYPAGQLVGFGSKVYKNKFWAGENEAPPASPWEFEADCIGSAPVTKYTLEEMRAMLKDGGKGLQVIYDPWTVIFPTADDYKAIEANFRQDRNIGKVTAATRIRPVEEAEKIQPGRAENPENVKLVERIFPEPLFDQWLPVRHKDYTYVDYLKGIGLFPAYCDTYTDGRDSEAICKRLIATSLAHAVQETGANWPSLTYGEQDSAHTNPASDKYFARGQVIPQWRQALWELIEIGKAETDDATSDPYRKCEVDTGERIWGLAYPCDPHKAYFGRGVKQLSWNYNYGPFSQLLYGDSSILLHNPRKVAESFLKFASGIWFAVTPQAPKPPMTWVIDGTWVPNSVDIAGNLKPGFGATIEIINGGLECNRPPDHRVTTRVNSYKEFVASFGLPPEPEDTLWCTTSRGFQSGSAAETKTYFDRTWDGTPTCRLVSSQTPWEIQRDGDYEKCVNYFFRSHYFLDGVMVSSYGGQPGSHWNV